MWASLRNGYSFRIVCSVFLTNHCHHLDLFTCLVIALFTTDRKLLIFCSSLVYRFKSCSAWLPDPIFTLIFTGITPVYAPCWYVCLSFEKTLVLDFVFENLDLEDCGLECKNYLKKRAG